MVVFWMSFAEGDYTRSPGCLPSARRTYDRQLSVWLCMMRHATRELLRTHLHGAADSSAVSESGRGERVIGLLQIFALKNRAPR